MRNDIKNLLEKIGLKGFVYYDLHAEQSRVAASSRWAMLRAVQRYLDATRPRSEDDTARLVDSRPAQHGLIEAVGGALPRATTPVEVVKPVITEAEPAVPLPKPALKLLGATQRYATEHDLAPTLRDTGAEQN